MSTSIFKKLNTIYSDIKRNSPLWKSLVNFFLIILVGAVIGYASEWLEYARYEIPELHSNWFLSGIALVFNNYSVWIFSASLIAYFSYNPFSAGLGTFLFLFSMCIAYFAPKHIHYGYDIKLQLAVWGIVALFSAVPAIIIWFSRGLGKVGMIIRSLPAAAILGETAITVYRCIDRYDPIPGRPAEPLKYLLQLERVTQLSIYIVFYFTLLFLLSKRAKERVAIILLSLPFGIFFTLILSVI